MEFPYHPPLALTIISSISIIIAGLAALWITLDIVLRRAWRVMMTIMIPVYIINALYLWPLTLWTYIKYGRPPKPEGKENSPDHGTHHQAHASAGDEDREEQTAARKTCHAPSSEAPAKTEEGQGPSSHACHSHTANPRPMFATVTVAVTHCGAGCVLGDIVGEWLVYGTSATIAGRELWAAYLVDFAFAIVLGVFFQYFSIAPMAGNYSPRILWRALKADVLSLLFFEIGLFGWMAVFQIAIFGWELEMDTVTYWWMMQIGMVCGHWTAVPINWWLIRKGVKEPCA